jgi:hypothetical protein
MASEGVSPKLIIGLGAVAIALLLGWIFAGDLIFSASPPPPEPIRPDGSGSESVEAPQPPPPGPLEDRVRIFYFNSGVQDCLQRYLAKESRVEGTVDVEIFPDGRAQAPAVSTEPNNPAVAFCVEQRLSTAFVYEGKPLRVAYSFSGRWNDENRLSMGQNVSYTDLAEDPR